MIKVSCDTELHEKYQCYGINDMQQEGLAPQLQSTVVIEETDGISIRIPQKTENQLHTQPDESCLVFNADESTDLQPNDALHKNFQCSSKNNYHRNFNFVQRCNVSYSTTLDAFF